MHVFTLNYNLRLTIDVSTDYLKWHPMPDKMAEKLPASEQNQWYTKDPVFWMAQMFWRNVISHLFVGNLTSFQAFCRFGNSQLHVLAHWSTVQIFPTCKILLTAAPPPPGWWLPRCSGSHGNSSIATPLRTAGYDTPSPAQQYNVRHQNCTSIYWLPYLQIRAKVQYGLLGKLETRLET